MGKVKILTPNQEALLTFIKNDSFLNSQFYFTGGTALSEVYLFHRFSEDLDFFSERPFEPQIVFDKIERFSQDHHARLSLRSIESVHIFVITFQGEQTLKVDFVHYPYKRVEQGKVVNEIAVDSILDIAINKLLSLAQRTEAKDFVDLYFLLKHFTIWDLIEGVRVKFRVELEPFIVASDMLKVLQLANLPKMIKPLTLEELKAFFKKRATEVGKTVLE